MSELRFEGKVVIVTGSGNGLGRAYAIEFARRGAKVVVNNPSRSTSNKVCSADLVVEKIKKEGGVAIANYNSVLEADKVVA